MLTLIDPDVIHQHLPGKRRRVVRAAVKVHVKHIMEKLGANDRTAAVTIAIRRGIIEL